MLTNTLFKGLVAAITLVISIEVAGLHIVHTPRSHTPSHSLRSRSTLCMSGGNDGINENFRPEGMRESEESCMIYDNDGIGEVLPEPVRMQAPDEDADNVDIGTYVFGKPGELRNDAEKAGIDPARFIGYNLLALMLALGANFVGVTSLLMSKTNPEYFRSIGLDQLYEVGGYRRYSSPEQKYQFMYPSTWEQDRAVLAQKLRLAETPSAMKKSVENTGPDVALGPVRGSIPRSNKNNVSVIKSKVLAGFSMQGTLGDPQQAAEFLLKSSIAPPASGKTYKLIGAQREGPGEKYVFEYTVKKLDSNGNAVFNQHSISVIANRGTDLYTCTVVAPEQDWAEREEQAKVVANSFQITP